MPAEPSPHPASSLEGLVYFSQRGSAYSLRAASRCWARYRQNQSYRSSGPRAVEAAEAAVTTRSE